MVVLLITEYLIHLSLRPPPLPKTYSLLPVYFLKITHIFDNTENSARYVLPLLPLAATNAAVGCGVVTIIFTTW